MKHSILLLVMSLSIIFQFLAAFWAIRLIKPSGAFIAWVLLACGFTIQGVRRIVSLTHVMNGQLSGDMTVEIMGLVISLLMLAGIWKFGPLFNDIRETHRILTDKQNELEKINLELLESDNRFRTLADFSSDWVFWRSKDREMRYISPACEHISGYTPNELTTNPTLIDMMVHSKDRELWDRHVREADHAKNPAPMEFRIVTKNGDIRWIDHICQPVFDQTGMFQGTRGCNRDISNRKRFEEQIFEKTLMLETEIDERQQIQEILAAKSIQLEMLNTTLEQRITNALEELRQNDRLMINQSRQAAMGDMINNIAHQWRQPLNNIGLIVQSIRYDFDAGTITAEQMAQEIDKCMEIISFMSQTINDFRNFFREDKETRLFNVRERIENAIKLMSASLKHNHISVFLDSDADVEVNGLPNEFSQAILNLLANARDALLERETTLPKITIKINCTETACVISISDNAGGIPDDIIDHVFDPYFTTKEQGKGTGIGLYITKTIIEKHMGGTVSVHNRVEGAEFRITIPAKNGIAA